MISLHINLLLDAERRNSSRVSRRFIIYITTGLAAFLFLVVILISYRGAYSTRQQLRFAEEEKKQLEPVYKSIIILRQELGELQSLTNALMGWAQSRPDWPRLLFSLQTMVPPDIQLTRLNINETVSLADNLPLRVITLYLRGKATGAHPERDVQQLERDLKEKAPFGDIMEAAQVKQFEAAKDQGQENVRIFELECRLKEAKLFQPLQAKPQGTK